MKVYLLLVAVAISLVLIESVKRRTKNSNCLVKNKYMHERNCRGPRRVYYTFHRVLFDCIQVTTNCRQIYRRNEYKTMKLCQDDCHYHMDPPYAAPIGKQTTTTAGEGATTGEGGEEAATEAGEGGGEGEGEAPAERTMRRRAKPPHRKIHQRSRKLKH
ncbi:uncharacterized protein LOC119548021 [Drosophila subpulchrella]|uniref:uncharacterized protein LOC119548021 n=1 Tax=Drosophila subpulchrella TaxID=1486046 RepID=UPI0018A173D8|nr:uncharacterized protein LOC119548021 [Drosophila subpulchrella]